MKKGTAITFAVGVLIGLALCGPAAQAADYLTARPTTQTFYVDGQKIDLTAYLIGGSNYVRLRDIGRAVNFGVDYHIENGELTIVPQEAATVEQVAGLYIAGASYQAIADSLNKSGIPFSPEAPLWNKHKVKRLLENLRYTGADGYPAILNGDTFQTIQAKIRSKTEGHTFKEKRPALLLKEYLRCPCGGAMHRLAGANRRKDTLYLKCQACGTQATILDADLLIGVARQMAEHDHPTEQPYTPSAEVVRLTNAINRGLEHPDAPEDVVSLILRGVSARYNCCPAPIEQEIDCRLSEANLKRFGQTASHITITGNQDVTVHFK